MQPIFITGTDTNIGKTFISAIIMAGLQASYWKPIQSGLSDGSDTDWLKSVTRLDHSHFCAETYLLNDPLSPHAAAFNQNVEIALSCIKLPEYKFRPLIIEGAGGVMVPINRQAYIIDVIKHLNAKVIVVAPNKLGVINHTLLTLMALRSYKLDIMGVILNGPPNQVNFDSIELYGKVKVLAQIEHLAKINKENLKQIFDSKLYNYFLDYLN